MSEVVAHILLDVDRRVFQPGEVLSGEFSVSSLAVDEPRAVELSVLWYTEGQGDEDLAVHHFERHSIDDDPRGDWRRPKRFRTVLPQSPLSYEGVLVKLFWSVRVRVFLAQDKEVVVEEAFRLGNVPAVYVSCPTEVAPA